LNAIEHPGTNQPVDPRTRSSWNEQVLALPQANVFHSAEWAAVLAESYGFTPAYFQQSDPGRIRAVLPVIEVDSWLTGRRGVCLPFTDQCGIAGDASFDSRRDLLAAAVEWGRKRGWRYLELRGESAVTSLASDARPSLEFFHHQVNLAGGEAQTFDNLHASVRRALRKADHEGVTVEVRADRQAMREYYRLHRRTRREHGLPPQPLRFFKKLQEQILARGRGTVILAQQGGSIVAGAVFLRSNNDAIYKFGASLPAALPVRANNSVMWAGIQWSLREGVKSLSLGRTSLQQEGLRRFKLGWGSSETQTAYYRFDLAHNAFVTDKDNTAGWHTHVFRAMPLSLNRLAGALLYRHIA
jgi:hypothetical protein